MKSLRLTAVVLGAVLAAAPALAQKIQINGAGATFPYPIYSKWFSEYNKLHPEVEINYQSRQDPPFPGGAWRRRARVQHPGCRC